MLKSVTEVRALTGLRGIAALAVVLYHFGNGFRQISHSDMFVVPSGYLAVDVFFVLSGFVLAYNYKKKFRFRVGGPDYRDFFVKRLARVYPAYFVVLLAMSLKLIASASGRQQFHNLGLADYFGNLFMLAGWGLGFKAIVGVSWSVSAELACYALFPFMIAYVMNEGGRVVILFLAASVAISAVALSGMGVNGALDVVTLDSQWSLVRALAGFSIGLASYFVFENRPEWVRLHGKTMLTLSLLLLAITWTPPFTHLAGRMGDLWRYPLFALLVLGCAVDTSVARNIFGNRILHFLGDISYSMYLIHIPIISLIMRLLPKYHSMFGAGSPWMLLVSYLSVVIGIAAIMYPTVERGGKAFLLHVARHALRRQSKSVTNDPAATAQ